MGSLFHVSSSWQAEVLDLERDTVKARLSMKSAKRRSWGSTQELIQTQLGPFVVPAEARLCSMGMGIGGSARSRVGGSPESVGYNSRTAPSDVQQCQPRYI